jgi:PPOX class probable F420-dependent enzyme
MAEQLEGRAKELLKEKNFALMATIRRDGTPHVNPVWVDADDGSVVINTAEGRAWPANARRDPRVTVTVMNHENPYEYVEIRGRVVEDTHDGADEHIDAMAKKYLGQDEYPFRQPGEQRVIFRIEPEEVRHSNPG